MRGLGGGGGGGGGGMPPCEISPSDRTAPESVPQLVSTRLLFSFLDK